ncbi:SulP family inorganic anion transporter [Cohnella boryungensis]|uniref:SulP family inorganic anion transporter n=1 Tax=Cohnella boryungensis TaxID=768479 RepID=A0ABV8SCZ6_9BACL
MIAHKLKSIWLFNVRADVLAGLTVAFALIPEAIAFSIIAGVDPKVGLYASFSIAVLISIFGGRPGMISAATGAMALLMVKLVADHGIEYLFAATVLTGIIQFLLGVLKIGRFITFVPHSVITGFINALAILIFMAQFTHFKGQSWIMYAMVGVTLIIIYALPRFTKVIPSALAAIVLMTIVSVLLGLDVRTVGDMGELPGTLPFLHLPDVPINLETLGIILPYALPLAFVGLIETLLTATIVDEGTETKSNKNKEARGQGIANFVTGLFGGMAGCAMIGQSVINVRSGGRGRLSTLVAGAFLMFLILVLGDLVKQLPMGALVGVMFMVSISTFDWKWIMHMRKIPVSDTLVMISTVAVVVYTDNLALGVMVGILLSAVIFGWRIAKIKVIVTEEEGGTKRYIVQGQMFFGTMAHFAELFDYRNDPDRIIMDFSATHVWDHSAVTAIAKAVLKYEQAGRSVTITGLNAESKQLVDKVGLSTASGH